MTDGEKMLWASIFGHEYSERMTEFRVDYQAAESYETQKDGHRYRCAAIAAEAATCGVLATRTLKTEDINDDTQEMMRAIFECD